MISSSGSSDTKAESVPMLKRLVGSWEAIAEGDFRVFKMEIASQQGESLVVMTAGRVNSVTLLFRVKRIDIRNGRFELDATGADGPDQLRVRGRVKRIGIMSSDGVIDANVVLVDEGSRPINSWHVAFLNYGGDYLSHLCQLSADAAAKIREARKGGTPPGAPSGR
jgi:hypothetical protein